MARTNAYSEVTELNVRLAVRQAVAEFCANPERTVKRVVNAQSENSPDLIQRLVAARLESIYEQLQCSILSPSDEPPSSKSFLRYLSGADGESEKDIVARFEHGNMLAQKQELDEWQKLGAPRLNAICPAPVPAYVPRLEDLTSGRPTRLADKKGCVNDKHRKLAKSGQKSEPFLCSGSTSGTLSTSTDQVWSKSASSSANNRRPIRQEGKSIVEGLLLPEAKGSSHSNLRAQRSPNYSRNVAKAVISEGVLAEIKKTAEEALPAVLEKEFIPTAPPLEEKNANKTPLNVKPKVPVSSCSSLPSDDDKVTVRYVPTKAPTADIAISTDSVVEENHPVQTVEVGVNTTAEMAEGSSSSNTASDNSAGQLPKRLFDTVLQRPSLRIVSLRPDGSIVPTRRSTPPHLPSVREWTLAPSEGNAKKSVPLSNAEIGEVVNEAASSHPEENEEAELDCVSAFMSRPDASEEDLNTMANISPLPHS